MPTDVRYQFPRPTRVGSKNTKSFGSRVYQWMTRSALRWLVDECQRTGEPLPSHEVLAARLEAYTWARGKRYIVSERDSGKPGKGAQRITSENLLRMADKAASFALTRYRPDFLETAAEGGRKTKRGHSFGIERLDEVKGMTNSDAARTLGCSVRTVQRMRARDRHVTSEIDSLLSSHAESEDGR